MSRDIRTSALQDFEFYRVYGLHDVALQDALQDAQSMNTQFKLEYCLKGIGTSP